VETHKHPEPLVTNIEAEDPIMKQNDEAEDALLKEIESDKSEEILVAKSEENLENGEILKDDNEMLEHHWFDNLETEK